jgi:hypothetical protein
VHGSAVSARITGDRLVKDALGWHIAFRVQTLERVHEPHQGPEAGIDAGVNIPLALSNNDHQKHRRGHRGRFGTFLSLPLLEVDGALEVIAYAYDQLGADGLALPTHTHGPAL